MKRTLSAVPVVAVAALSLGVFAPAASADPLPLPSPSTLVTDVTGLLPVPLPTASPSPTGSLVPVPLPTTEPSLVAAPTTASRTAAKSVLPTLRSEARTRPMAALLAAPAAAAPLTGETSGLAFRSATVPAWASYLTRPVAPTVAAAPAPASLTTTRAASAPADPAGLPGVATTLALVLVAMTGAGHVLVRRGALPLR